jgi:death-on-curing protein
LDPIFLNLAEVIEIHHDQIHRYGGKGGIRDITLLQSALAIPSASYGGDYLHHDLCEMAAAYLFHIIRNHPFIDGNKRTGTVAALVFLEVNEVKVEIDEKALEELVLDVACGKKHKATVAAFFRENAIDP